MQRGLIFMCVINENHRHHCGMSASICSSRPLLGLSEYEANSFPFLLTRAPLPKWGILKTTSSQFGLDPLSDVQGEIKTCFRNYLKSSFTFKNFHWNIIFYSRCEKLLLQILIDWDGLHYIKIYKYKRFVPCKMNLQELTVGSWLWCGLSLWMQEKLI